MENNTREIIINTFEEYFTTKVKEANIIVSQNNHYSKYLKEIRKVLIREIDKNFKTGGNFSNIFHLYILHITNIRNISVISVVI
jgi:hypothetical protein